MVKFVVFGLGMVGNSFLNLVKKEGLFNTNSWYVIDKTDATKNEFVTLGGNPSNFIQLNIKQKQYDELFSFLEKGDYLLDFSSAQTNTDFLKICMQNDIHYLSTSSLPYEDGKSYIPSSHDFEIYKQLKGDNNPTGATSIIEFGMNPGLVSCFTKQCIKEIIKHDKNDFVVKNREYMQSLLEQNNYAKIAQLLGIEIIHISDIDTTKTNFAAKEKCVYSTWNIESFCEETLGQSELALGTDVNIKIFDGMVDSYNEDKGFLLLNKTPLDCPEQSYSPWGSFNGYIVPHEEMYTISDFLSVEENGKVSYKPSVYFVYKPSEIAVDSLLNYRKDNYITYESHLIMPEDIASGGEAVGIVIDGKNFTTRYFGNKLLSPIENETPTILQVSASAYAAFRYMLNNPNKGFLFPEEVDDEQVLEYAKPILNSFDSFECPKLERTLFNKNKRNKLNNVA